MKASIARVESNTHSIAKRLTCFDTDGRSVRVDWSIKAVNGEWEVMIDDRNLGRWYPNELEAITAATDAAIELASLKFPAAQLKEDMELVYRAEAIQ